MAVVITFSESISAQETVENTGTVLDTITITARKRAESVHDVPISVTVKESGDLAVGTIDTGADLARETPNFNFVDFAGPGGNYATMRGIGPLGSPLNSLDNTIGFSVDGVPTSSFGFSPTLMDVERVEVLRGPQGTMFGRNALGGAVNVINKPADGTREFRLNTEYGSDNYALAEAIAGGWIVPDQLAGRGVLRFQNFDGDIPNPILDRTEGAARVQAGRGTVTYTPDNTLTMTLSGGFDFDKRTNPLYLLKEHPDYPISGVDVPQYGKREMGYGNFTVTKDFENFSLTSITGYQHIDVSIMTDDAEGFLYDVAYPGMGVDYNQPGLFYGTSYETEKLFTQEVRLNSTEGSPVSWVAGVSYFRSDYTMDRDQTNLFSSTLNGANDTDILSQTWAAFGDISVPLSDRLTASGGLRIAHDRQEMDSLFVSNGFPGTVPSFAQDRSFEDTYLTGRAALSWKWNDDLISYASIARGYASGGFERYTSNAANGIASDPFLPSTVWTYEIGTKTMLLDQRVELNGSLFYNDVKDGQVTTFDPTTFIVGFANQDYRSYGFELEGKFTITENWALTGGIGVSRSELRDVDPNTITGAVNGNAVPNSPEFTANLGVEFSKAVTLFGMDGRVAAAADYQYVGTREADIQNSFKLNDYHLVNLRVGLEQDNRSVYAFARNVFDERPEFFGSTFGPTAHSLIIGRGRVIGVGASVSW
ncbi:TonB-dependent receptor [Brucella pecoris]|nr:TonB-dependent receptor [Brucella pecoris]MBB4096199.1 iron complex outermembrane receptor protein [Brucella pecoris]